MRTAASMSLMPLPMGGSGRLRAAPPPAMMTVVGFLTSTNAMKSRTLTNSSRGLEPPFTLERVTSAASKHANMCTSCMMMGFTLRRVEWRRRTHTS